MRVFLRLHQEQRRRYTCVCRDLSVDARQYLFEIGLQENGSIENQRNENLLLVGRDDLADVAVQILRAGR